ncbi:MAG: 1-deoxy-D-xylulose-5-phosphate reductoisomerase, partial [Kiritimatiellae bacterium]|nr:1-deoxy-D-xylulose-5-phosphate reductoisomerase [Kiritimatiellia bacterium]
GSLEFRRPDERRFPAIALARKALEMGGDAPARLAAADERAVAEFLAGKIGYTDIMKICEEALCSNGL